MSLARFMELFQGRSDAFAEQQDDGSYRPIRRPMTREDYLAHGRGEHTYGIYTVRSDNATKLIAWDLDTFDGAVLGAICKVLQHEKIDYLIEESGRKGWHIWVFLDQWAPASHAYMAGRAVMQQARVEVECYPKQQHVTDLGNLIKLPLGIHRVNGKRSRFYETKPGGWAATEPIDALQLVYLADSYQEPPLPAPSRVGPGIASQSVEARVEHSLGKVVLALPGGRNETLYREAVSLLGLRTIDRTKITASLMDAAAMAGLTRTESSRTINSATRFVDRNPPI